MEDAQFLRLNFLLTAFGEKLAFTFVLIGLFIDEYISEKQEASLIQMLHISAS